MILFRKIAKKVVEFLLLELDETVEIGNYKIQKKDNVITITKLD